MDNLNIDDQMEQDYDEAYLLAASFFLNSWPMYWSADRLSMALLAKENDLNFEDQNQIKIWPAILKFAESEGEDEMVFTEGLIYDLADTMVIFKHKKKGLKIIRKSIDYLNK